MKLTRTGIIPCAALALSLLSACSHEQPAEAAGAPAPIARGGGVPDGGAPAQWRVVWTEEPQTRAVVAWTTAVPGESHQVLYDTESRRDGAAEYRWRVPCQVNGEYTALGTSDLFYHHATLEGLTPSTTYYFVMKSDGQASRELWFQTAPADDRPFAILHGGDSRSDRDMRRRMNQRIAQLAKDDETILAMAHGGDYVYLGILISQWSDWMTDWELTTTDDGRVLPIIPVRGNHESFGLLYDEVFGSPGGGFGRNYFATRLGAGALMITLNSEIAAGGDQTNFLAECLAENTDVRWQVVQYHRPIWPAVKEPARSKVHWQPLFDAHGVDLSCESDGHVLKRTVPIRGDAAHPQGVVYIGEGGLGVPQRTPKDTWYLEPPGMAASVHHVWRLRFGPTALELEAISMDGEIVDRSALKPRR